MTFSYFSCQIVLEVYLLSNIIRGFLALNHFELTSQNGATYNDKQLSKYSKPQMALHSSRKMKGLYESVMLTANYNL
jgi:hypothetical protein